MTKQQHTPKRFAKISKFSNNEYNTKEILRIFDIVLTPLEVVMLYDMALDDLGINIGDMLSIVLSSRKVKTKIQSDAVENVSSTDTSKEWEENVGFMDETEQIDLVVGQLSTDPTFSQGMQENANLGNFMSRPVEIFKTTWLVNAATPFLDVINPWELFLNNAKVKNKLQTFKLLHSTLKLKIVLNGSPFHYGRAVIGVRPTRFDNNMSNTDMNFAALSARQYSDYAVTWKTMFSGRTLYSSRPIVFVDPATNQPNHIDWPFFAATNWIDLTNADTVDRLGRLEIWELSQLRHANGATDPITISIFAWLEDVELTGLTKTDPVIQAGESSTKKVNLSNNSGKNNDEYNKKGAISAPASVVVAAAGYFTEIPYIGKFAKATQMAAGTVGDIARIFGFARPPIVMDPMLIRPQGFGNMANYIGGDPLVKLSLDPKQELSVDPSTVGLPGDDQMSFGYLVKKEAWIDSFPWTQSIGADIKLYTIQVHPMVTPLDDLTTYNLFHPTPLSFVTNPFQFWSGSLRYRFQIVASNFHRGRLLIQYDPTGISSTTPDLNSRYSQIVDISEDRDFTVEVKWSQAEAYRKTDLFNDNVIWTTIGPTGTMVEGFVNNGILEVYVLNELASPVDAADIEVNVFISGGDNFEVRAPNSAITQYAYAKEGVTVGPPATTQSGEETTKAENDPSQATDFLINGSYCGCDPTKNNVYFGEVVLSARSLLKRYNYYRPMCFDAQPVGDINSVNFDIFNFPNGPGPSYGSSIASPITPIAAGNYNVANLTMLRYFASGYIGWRGGIKWKQAYISDTTTMGNISVTRRSERRVLEAIDDKALRGTGISALNTAKRVLDQTGYNGVMQGTHVSINTVNPSLEYEVPMYTNYRYVEVNEPPLSGTVKALDTYQSHYNGGSHAVNYTDLNTDASGLGFFNSYVSTGEDFSFFFFIGASPYMFTDITTVT